MRLIGRLNDEASAKTFGDYLAAVEIRNVVEHEADGWTVWVYSEDQLEAARTALAGFQANPSDLKYQRAAEKAAVLRERERKEKDAYAKRVVTKDTLWGNFGIGPVTIALIAVSVGVAVFLGMPPATTALYISIFVDPHAGLPEVRHGEVWRLITPIFMHFTIYHILFNMLALKYLGGMIETRMGSLKLAIIVLVIGIGSNLGQYFWKGPDFGGMSGVLYGLFGYIWMRGKFDPTSGLRLSQADVVMMVGWYFLCLFNLVGDVANTCHTVGLAMGMAWGVAPSAKKLLKL